MKSELINVRPDARKQSNGCSGSLEREEWWDVKGYESYYQVSSFGRVKSLERVIHRTNGTIQTINERILKCDFTKEGYPRVCFCIGYNGKHQLIHRLVAEAFIPNPYNLPCVNHRNEDKTANYPDNLEWCDHKYNINYGTRNKRQSKKLKGRIVTEVTRQRCKEANRTRMRPVLQYSPNGELIAEYESMNEAARQLNLTQSLIWKVTNNKGETAGGFVWRYKE